jgi:hypothetical protein
LIQQLAFALFTFCSGNFHAHTIKWNRAKFNLKSHPKFTGSMSTASVTSSGSASD